MKVETDINTSTVASLIGQALILMIMYVKIFTTDVIVFICNAIMCWTSYWPIIFSSNQFVVIDSITWWDQRKFFPNCWKIHLHMWKFSNPGLFLFLYQIILKCAKCFTKNTVIKSKFRQIRKEIMYNINCMFLFWHFLYWPQNIHAPKSVYASNPHHHVQSKFWANDVDNIHTFSANIKKNYTRFGNRRFCILLSLMNFFFLFRDVHT